MKLLTPEEVLQALKDGKSLEWTYEDADEWYEFIPKNFPVESLCNNYYSFRLVQEMVKIGDVSFPKPETKPLEMNTEYWVADPISSNFTAQSPSKWENDTQDNRFLSRGFIHLSKENAIAHSKALIKLSGGTYE